MWERSLPLAFLAPHSMPRLPEVGGFLLQGEESTELPALRHGLHCGNAMTTSRIMWIERKQGLAGPARIGRVTFSKSRKSIHYRGKTFHSLGGQGFKANYAETGTGEEYWISGCRKDGKDALYNTEVEIDEDVREEYWTAIRGLPEKSSVTRFRAMGKCR
jgi:hypothetical protein